MVQLGKMYLLRSLADVQPLPDPQLCNGTTRDTSYTPSPQGLPTAAARSACLAGES